MLIQTPLQGPGGQGALCHRGFPEAAHVQVPNLPPRLSLPAPSGQLYEVRPVTETRCIGAPLQHRAADLQVRNLHLHIYFHLHLHFQAAGTAVYIDDMRRLEGELYLAFVLSTRARATIISLDTRAAMAVAGVEAWLDHASLPADSNRLAGDEPLFAEGVVHCHGQVVGAVVAVDKETAQVTVLPPTPPEGGQAGGGGVCRPPRPPHHRGGHRRQLLLREHHAEHQHHRPPPRAHHGVRGRGACARRGRAHGRGLRQDRWVHVVATVVVVTLAVGLM